MVNVFFNFFQFIEISNPFIPNFACNELCKLRVGMQQKSPLGYSVSFVIEFSFFNIIKILEGKILENIGMKPGNSVNRMTSYNGKIRHSYHSPVSFLHN